MAGAGPGSVDTILAVGEEDGEETAEQRILIKLTEELATPAMDNYNKKFKGARQSVLGKNGLAGGNPSTMRKMCQDPKRLEEFRLLADSKMKRQGNNHPIVPEMFFEVRKNEDEFVRLCLETGVNINVKSPDLGRTLLHEASALGYTGLVKMLVNVRPPSSLQHSLTRSSSTGI